MKLDLRGMLAGECRTLPIDYNLPLSYDPEDRTSSLWGVSFPADLHVSGEIVNNAGYMRMTLTLTAPYTAPCARCLEPVQGVYEYTTERTVAPAKLLTEHAEEDSDDYAVIEDGFLDMDDELAELLELTFPTKILCREDCRGLCPKCGKNLNEGDCACDTKEFDPRLEPLRRLLEEMKAEDGN